MVKAANAKNLADAFFSLASENPSRTVYRQAIAQGDDSLSEVPRPWKATSYSEVESAVKKIAAYLKEKGVSKGDKVAILSASRPEWMWADLAILSVGAVCASVYHSLPADDVAYILFDSDTKFIFIENEEQLEKIKFVEKNEHEIPATEDRPASRSRVSIDGIISFEEVPENDKTITLNTLLQNEEAEIPEIVADLTRDDLASLVYTSGTTGPPKGVMQTHGNHLANVRQTFESEMLMETNSLALFLPLAHSFARLMGYLGFLTLVELRFPAVIDRKSSRLVPQSVSKDIREGSADINPVVPRLLEKMREGVNAKAHDSKVLSLTLWAAQENYKAKKAGKSAGIEALLAYAVTSPIRKKIKKKLFGDSFEFCISGGAKLNLAVSEYFDALGIPVLQGYGLTETCVATNVDRMKKRKLNTVGPVLSEDIELRINDDGEVLLKGPNLAVGYYNRPTATKEAWDDEGWYHTGDLGSLDEDNYLSITGRKKEIIITSGGKNIAPHDIEEAIKDHSLVSQAVLIGDGRKYCIALVALNTEAAEKWCKANCSKQGPAHSSSEVFASVWEHVSTMNDGLASFETVKRMFIVPEEFSVDNGLLTPTFKTKRPTIEAQYKEEIDKLFLP